ncbi:MAG TPA: redoxin domain-containing protein [Rubrobacteraceae bacterium]|nr:redoxin domain-containing protein [Rubrobacteraceae bacterium]
MRRLLVVAFLVLVAAGAYRSLGSAETGTGTLTLAQPAPNVGQQVPGFAATGIDEENFDLSERGTFVLTYWSTLNKSSDDARPDFARLADKYGDRGVSFAAVYVNGAPSEDENAPYVVIQDSNGRLASIYNVKRVPRLFLIRNGKIELVQNGFYPGSTSALRAKLDELTKEKERPQESR